MRRTSNIINRLRMFKQIHTFIDMLEVEYK